MSGVVHCRGYASGKVAMDTAPHGHPPAVKFQQAHILVYDLARGGSLHQVLMKEEESQ